VELAVETAVAETADKLPSRWGNAVRDNVCQSEEHLVAVLDRQLAMVDLELSPPPWWWLATVAQYLLGLTAVIGAAWLFLLGVATVIDSDVVGSATTLGVPASLLMVVLGLLGGAVLTALCAWLLTVGARRRRLLVQERLTGAVREVAEEQVMMPIRAVLDQHRTTRLALAGRHPEPLRSRPTAAHVAPAEGVAMAAVPAVAEPTISMTTAGPMTSAGPAGPVHPVGPVGPVGSVGPEVNAADPAGGSATVPRTLAV
jgi:hypothetical protein